MNNVYYQLYLESIMAFARTLVIKIDGLAEHINEELKINGNVVETNPQEWKYYMNLYGEYHHTDETMWVRSVDTQEEIVFSKENLAVHRGTAREYSVGSKYFNDLVNRYPNQSNLIVGIMYPVDKLFAIEAKSGSILYYNDKLIESTELNVIPNLQHWLDAYFNKWYNPNYAKIDDLYLASFIGVLYLYIPRVIFNLRLRNAKTINAHSFHIRQYLASNGGLDKYIKYLTQEQQLFLYRNIRYLQRNAGKDETFLTLVENILTKRGLPLDWYKLKQNIENLPESIYPEVEMVKDSINMGYNEGRDNRKSVGVILEKERPLARDNQAIEDVAVVEIPDIVRSDKYSSLATKVLESEVIDRTDSSVRPFKHVLMMHWVYMAGTERYRAYVQIAHPLTGEIMNMSVKDALIMTYYCVNKIYDLGMDKIPRVHAYEVIRDTLPSFAELKECVSDRWVPDYLIEAIQDRITPVGEHISTEGFYLAMVQLHNQFLRLVDLYSTRPTFMQRGMCKSLVYRHFKDIKVELADRDLTFDRWDRQKGFKIGDMPERAYLTLFEDCVNIATGSNLAPKLSLSDIQSAMLSIMKTLSSYTVQYIRDINMNNFLVIEQPDIRIDNIQVKGSPHLTVPIKNISVQDIKAKAYATIVLNDENAFPLPSISASAKASICVNTPLEYKVKHIGKFHIPININNVFIRDVEATLTTNISGNDLEHYNQ